MPTLFATLPSAAIRSAPVSTRSTWPAASSDAAALSASSECGIPARRASQAVSRAPCSSGRVSSTQSRASRPPGAPRESPRTQCPPPPTPERRCCSASGSGHRPAPASARARPSRRSPRRPRRQSPGLRPVPPRAPHSTCRERGSLSPSGSRDTTAAPGDTPAQVHRRRPGRADQRQPPRAHVVAAVGGQRDPERPGHAEQRRAAHHQPADGVDQLRDVRAASGIPPRRAAWSGPAARWPGPPAARASAAELGLYRQASRGQDRPGPDGWARPVGRAGAGAVTVPHCSPSGFISAECCRPITASNRPESILGIL